jgi:hypothetical protein
VCVSFTSFLILNFQPSLVRLYAGYAPIHILAWLLERRRQRWRRKKIKLDDDFNTLLNETTPKLENLKKDIRKALRYMPVSLPLERRGKELIERTITQLKAVREQLEEPGTADEKGTVENAIKKLQAIKQLLENQERLNTYKQAHEMLKGLRDESEGEQLKESLEESKREIVKTTEAYLEKIKLPFKDQEHLNAYIKLAQEILRGLDDPTMPEWKAVKLSLQESKTITEAVELLESVKKLPGSSAQLPSVEKGRELDWFLCRASFTFSVVSKIRPPSIKRLEKICKSFIDYYALLNSVPSVETGDKPSSRGS